MSKKPNKAPVKITEAEIWSSNILNAAIQVADAELRRTVAARDAYMQLLEIKYNAIFDSRSGQLRLRQ